MNSAIETCRQKLLKAGAAQIVIENFTRLHGLVSSGETGIIPDASIEPLTDIPRYEDINSNAEMHKGAPYSELVVCKLNGGLGTSMGLTQAKSLLHVSFDKKLDRKLSFNEVNARQVALLDAELPFMNMVSFSTEEDVKKDLMQTELGQDQQYFLMQNIHPKIYSETLSAADHEDDSLCWNPPGHGDFYQAFYASGQLEKFVKQGKKYLFVSNADNLSAYPCPVILNYMAKSKVSFLMEVTNRTEADKKGGHLARRKSDGRIILRESAQAETDDKGQIAGDFQDIHRHSYFNLNSMWIDLRDLLKVMQDNNGVLPLPLIRNSKTLDPRDSKSPQVYQLETAMGAAIEFFDSAQLLLVSRERFAPVKTCSDLLLILSDCFSLDSKAVLTPKLGKMPQINLSSEYKLIDDFERLIKVVPSLVSADKFSLSGNIQIADPVKIIGQVVIVDLRSDRAEPHILSAIHSSLANVRISITDSGESIEAI